MVRSSIVATGIALAAIGAAQAQTTTAPTTAAPSASAAAGKHMVDGKVTKVNAKKGWVDVKTSEGSMKLHFPPPALENVKAGDSVTVEIGMTASAASMDKTTDAKKVR